MNRVEDRCPYCDTEFMVEFESDEDELYFWPACGEELPEYDEEVEYYDEEYEWDDE
jgi:hypothetical protein